jgi:FkbM family methyltransferase
MLQFLYRWTPFIPKFFSIPKCINRQFSDSAFLRLIQFWQEHEGEFKFTPNGYATLKELNTSCKIAEARTHFIYYFRTRNKYEFSNENGQVYMKIDGFTFLLNFPHGIFELLEIFQDNCYEAFDVKNKTVVDIGAFIGDTAIYFAGKGAKKIIAYEPNPPIYEIAKKNIQLNKLTNKIQIRQQAVTNKHGTRNFMVIPTHPGASTIHFKREGAKKEITVNTIPLSAITQELGHIDLLKLDCEGAEYEILPTAYTEGALNNIDKIAMEIHGPAEPILDILHKAKFKVTKKQKNLESPVHSHLTYLFAQKTRGA